MSSFKWVTDNATLTYHNFDWDQPDERVERCVFLKMSTSPRWHDIRCSRTLNALCEAAPVCIHKPMILCWSNSSDSNSSVGRPGLIFVDRWVVYSKWSNEQTKKEILSIP